MSRELNDRNKHVKMQIESVTGVMLELDYEVDLC